MPAAAEVSGQDPSTPLLFFPSWPLDSLTVASRRRIRAGLLEIHGAFLDDKINEHVECWRLTYDLIAEEFHRARKLSADLLNTRIPEVVADAAAGGGWPHEPLGRMRPTGIFSCRFGSQFYPLWRQTAFLEALKGRIAHWNGRPLVKRGTPAPADSHPKKASIALRAHRHAIIKAFMKQNSHEGMAALTFKLGVSETALQGMIRGEKKRYSDDKLDSVLKQIGCPRAKWDRAAKPPPA